MRSLLPLMLVLLAFAAPARADDQALQEARQLFGKGQQLYRQGHFARALEQFQQAANHARRPSITLNMAQCHRNLEHHKKAIFLYRLYLSEWARAHPDRAAPFTAEVQTHIKRLQAKLEAARRKSPPVAPRPKVGLIKVQGITVARAQVLVNDAPRAVSPVRRPIKVEPGQHEVRVEAAGHHSWRRTVTVKPGQSVALAVRLRPITTRRRSTAWLVATVAGLALAAGAETVGLYYNLRANDHFNNTEPYFEARDISVAGHVVAGSLVALSTVSLVLYLRSGRQEPASSPSLSAAVIPAAGGVTGSLGFQF